MGDAGVTVFICTTCRTGLPGHLPGQALIEAVDARLRLLADAKVFVKGIECLSVCKRPCTIALAGTGKWTYVIGDLDPAIHVDDLVSMSLKYGASGDGIVPWRERPPVFRKSMISRVPPLDGPASA